MKMRNAFQNSNLKPPLWLLSLTLVGLLLGTTTSPAPIFFVKPCVADNPIRCFPSDIFVCGSRAEGFIGPFNAEFYSISLSAGQTISADIDTDALSLLDSVLAIYACNQSFSHNSSFRIPNIPGKKSEKNPK